MTYGAVKRKAQSLFEEASFISHIASKAEYKQALQLMDELIEDYDNNRPLIEVLSVSIERWEENDDEFYHFNQQIKKLDSAEATFQCLMEQYDLGVADFPEIGSKSLVSRILNKERRLTRDHIANLCQRFNIHPDLFF